MTTLADDVCRFGNGPGKRRAVFLFLLVFVATRDGWLFRTSVPASLAGCVEAGDGPLNGRRTLRS
jgi:hypothetical protein